MVRLFDKNIKNYGVWQVKFNGVLYLARHKYISDQYIGSGKSAGAAIKDGQDTINKHSWRERAEQYF